jgi:predicted GNAT family acetyltransferase
VILQPGDEAMIEAFLRPHITSSMFLLSNLRHCGLTSGTWAGAFQDGALVGVLQHAPNGNLLLQAPQHLSELVREVTRPVRGLIGPWPQVVAARAVLGLTEAPCDLDSREDLFELDLSQLIVPEPLRAGHVTCQLAHPRDRDLLVSWRAEYQLEALGRTHDAAQEVDDLLARSDLYVLHQDNRPVACSAFNSRLPDCVQIGGVWTPPELRSRGYARAAVAGSLLHAGVPRSVLFTDPANLPAQRAYLALGYEIIGEYGLVLFQRS